VGISAFVERHLKT